MVERRHFRGVQYHTNTTGNSDQHASTHVRDEPSWQIERPLKNLQQDLPAWELASLYGELDAMDISSLTSAWEEVGEVYFLETGIGVPLFDFVAGVREGGFETRIYDFMSPDLELKLYELKDR